MTTAAGGGSRGRRGVETGWRGSAAPSFQLQQQRFHFTCFPQIRRAEEEAEQPNSDSFYFKSKNQSDQLQET